MADDIDMRPVTPFYRIRFDDGARSTTRATPRDAAEIAALAPDDVAGYERFLAMSEEIFKVGFEQLAHVPFSRWTDMAKIVPDMMKLESYRTVYGLVSKYVKDERLRQVLSFHPLLVGGNPFSTTSIYTLIAFLERKWGVHFPIGGTGALVPGLVGLIEGQGGEVRLSARGAQILVENGRARGVLLAGGERLEADVVVSNADSAWTYRHLVPPEAPRRWTDTAHRAARYSMSLFVWYFGTKRSTRRRRPPHHPARAALQGPARRHLRSPRPGRRLQPLPAPAHGDRSVARAARLRRRSTCCRRCRTCRAAPTGARAAEPYRQAHRAVPGALDAARARANSRRASR
jgi:phytoene desaturase